MLLITITGNDKPGVSSALFHELGHFPVDILDIEQVVINRMLILGVHIDCTIEQVGKLVEAINQVMHGINMRVAIDFDSVYNPANNPTEQYEHHSSSAISVGEKVVSTHSILILGQPLHSTAVSEITTYLAKRTINIDSIHSVADYPLTGIGMKVSLPEKINPETVRADLALIAPQYGADVAIENSRLRKRPKRLIVFDVDSTLIQGEVIEMLAERAGSVDEVARITEEAMRGAIDFTQSLYERVATLRGLPESVVTDVINSIVFTPGARTTIHILKQFGFKIGLVSGGFHQVVDVIGNNLGVDYIAANTLEIFDGKLTGKVTGLVIDRAAKADALIDFAEQWGIDLEQTVAVGDGANDIDMINTAGLGIAFRAKPALVKIADAAITYPYLDVVLFILGFTRPEIEAFTVGRLEG